MKGKYRERAFEKIIPALITKIEDNKIVIIKTTFLKSKEFLNFFIYLYGNT